MASAERPQLRVLEAAGRRPPKEWDAVADELWPAWRSLPTLEERAEDHFGPTLGRELLVLWALSRFGSGSADDDQALRMLVGDDLKPRFGAGIVADMALMAFALGTGWKDWGGGS